MPARMWRHGIHEFLEVGRPGPEYMLFFMYIAHSLMALAGTESLRLEKIKKKTNERTITSQRTATSEICEGRKRYHSERKHGYRPDLDPTILSTANN